MNQELLGFMILQISMMFALVVWLAVRDNGKK